MAMRRTREQQDPVKKYLKGLQEAATPDGITSSDIERADKKLNVIITKFDRKASGKLGRVLKTATDVKSSSKLAGEIRSRWKNEQSKLLSNRLSPENLAQDITMNIIEKQVTNIDKLRDALGDLEQALFDLQDDVYLAIDELEK